MTDTEGTLKEPWRHTCPRCHGQQCDPKLEPQQSCLICWAEGSIDLNNEGWDGQFRKALEHFITDPERRGYLQ